MPSQIKSKAITKKPKQHAIEERKFGELAGRRLQSKPAIQD